MTKKLHFYDWADSSIFLVTLLSGWFLMHVKVRLSVPIICTAFYGLKFTLNLLKSIMEELPLLIYIASCILIVNFLRRCRRKFGSLVFCQPVFVRAD